MHDGRAGDRYRLPSRPSASADVRTGRSARRPPRSGSAPRAPAPPRSPPAGGLSVPRPSPGSWTGIRAASADTQLLQHARQPGVADRFAALARKHQTGRHDTGRGDAEPARVVEDLDRPAAQRNPVLPPRLGARRGHRPARPGRCCRRRCGAARARSGRGRASGQRRRSGPTGCRCGACRGWQSPRGRWLSLRVPTTEHISPAPAQPNGYVHGSTGPRPGSRGRGSAGGRRGRGVDLDEPGSVCRCLRRPGVAPARSCVPRGFATE